MYVCARVKFVFPSKNFIPKLTFPITILDRILRDIRHMPPCNKIKLIVIRRISGFHDSVGKSLHAVGSNYTSEQLQSDLDY